MYKAVILPHAVEDIRDAAKWYNRKQESLGKRFTEEVRGKSSLSGRAQNLQISVTIA
jgi:hypothetical protein